MELALNKYSKHYTLTQELASVSLLSLHTDFLSLTSLPLVFSSPSHREKKLLLNCLSHKYVKYRDRSKISGVPRQWCRGVTEKFLSQCNHSVTQLPLSTCCCRDILHHSSCIMGNVAPPKHRQCWRQYSYLLLNLAVWNFCLPPSGREGIYTNTVDMFMTWQTLLVVVACCPWLWPML